MTDGDNGAPEQLDWLPQNASLIAVVRETVAGSGRPMSLSG